MAISTQFLVSIACFLNGPLIAEKSAVRAQNNEAGGETTPWPFSGNISSTVTDPTTIFSSTSTTTEIIENMSERSWVEGVYDYKSSVNFDNYLKALGVPYLLRTLAGLASPQVTISKSCSNENEVSTRTSIVLPPLEFATLTEVNAMKILLVLTKYLGNFSIMLCLAQLVP